MSATTYIVRCSACCAAQRCSAESGAVAQVTVQHEPDCPFLAALERSSRDAQRWIAEHGYPISYEAAQ